MRSTGYGFHDAPNEDYLDTTIDGFSEHSAPVPRVRFEVHRKAGDVTLIARFACSADAAMDLGNALIASAYRARQLPPTVGDPELWEGKRLDGTPERDERDCPRCLTDRDTNSHGPGLCNWVGDASNPDYEPELAREVVDVVRRRTDDRLGSQGDEALQRIDRYIRSACKPSSIGDDGERASKHDER